MNVKKNNKIEYIIADPTKNITALVLSQVKVYEQPKIAKEIMEKESNVEQVGFLSESESGDITLRMAGGEFCGNAVMSTAAYFATQKKEDKKNIKVHVLDIKEDIDVFVSQEEPDIWLCQETITYDPKIIYIDIENHKNVPLVNLYGISHIIFTFTFNEETFKDKNYEIGIKKCCEDLSVPALGFMFYDEKGSRIIPLVYVKDTETLFWEKSCASGTIAVATFLADRDKKSIEKEMIEPGGVLKVLKEKEGQIKLEGKVKLMNL